MKNIGVFIGTILINLMLPLNILAYSDYVIPGGQSVGIEINTKGILIVGFYKVDGKLNKGDLKVGDRITEVNGIEINTVDELVSTIEKEMKDDKVEITYIRNDKTRKTDLSLVYEDSTYKTGLYVKDSITGIGTLTYIDPETKIYGALGHEIIESNTDYTVEVKSGTIFRSSITSIDRSVSGTPGGKNAKFFSNTVFGQIEKNVTSGIYGEYTSTLPDTERIKVASLDEVEEGKAYIYTVLNGEELGKYEIEITKIDKRSETKNLYFKVTDKTLLEKTGGIVQGMSGSPIIQNDKIIGAVTHVVVSNPSSGYGISIITMLEEGETKA